MKSDVDANEVASFLEALEVSILNGEVKSDQVKSVIKSLPSPAHIRRHLSDEEARVVFESVRWAWKEISGKDITDSFAVEEGPERLMGNYWMLSNGIMLHGVNHYVIIKRNLTMFAELLNIDPFVLHKKLAGPPINLIKLVLDHGGMRMFITKDGRAYFQMNDKIYGKWGRAKVKGFDFKNKTVNLIDALGSFKGWKSGITVRL